LALYILFQLYGSKVRRIEFIDVLDWNSGPPEHCAGTVSALTRDQFEIAGDDYRVD